MCYMVLLSTTADVDLTVHNSNLLKCSLELPPLAEAALLKFPHQWFVASREGCSCGFRHLHTSAIELGFDVPQDWLKEEPADIAATLEFVGLVRILIGRGDQVDCIDVWGHESDTANLAGTIHIDLLHVASAAFRFMEGYRFVFGRAA
jgi:hypothetical protein